MPTYRVQGPEGNFRIESPDEMSDDEINAMVDSQQAPKADLYNPPETSHPEAGAGYFQRTARRVNEAGAAALDIPSAFYDTITGGERGRLEAGLRLLKGISSPVDILTSPVESAVEYAATPYLSEEASRTAGSVSAIPFTLGVGLLAKAGKLGVYGQQLAKVLGVGASDAISQFKRDPQLRYAAQLPTAQVEAPVMEQLARTAATPEELALAIKSPVTAGAILHKYKAQGDIWLEKLKAEGMNLDEIPQSPVLTQKEIMAFEVTRTHDQGLLGTLGTPTAQAAQIHPLGAQVAYDMAEAEMKLKHAVDARGVRNEKALGAVGDKAISDAIKLRNVKEFDDIMTDPKIGSDVQGVVDFLKNKLDVDRDILVPRLQEQEATRIRAAMEKVEATKPSAARLSPAEIDRQVQLKSEKIIPKDSKIDDLLLRVFPTHYKIMDKAGKFIESANNRGEAMMKIKDYADANGLKASDFTISQRAIFDADLLKFFQGRVARHFEQMAKNQGLSPADVEAAIRGDFSMHAPADFFNQFLGASAKGMTRDVTNSLKFYDRSVEKWLHINDLEKTAKPMLKELGDRGYRRLADTLYGSLEALKGHRSVVGEYFDNSIAGIPGVHKLISPYALERWTSTIKSGMSTAFLRASPRFWAVNATQMAQTLYPIADSAGDIARAFKLRSSEAGQALLARHSIKGIGTRVQEFSKSLPFERQNQEVSFLTMYDKARRLGLSDDQAASYGRLRGNLHSQFLGLVTDTPKAFRAVDPTGLMLMYKRFPVKNFELGMDMLKSRQYPGVAKWLGVNLAMGGMKAAMLGDAGWLGLELYDKVKKEFGEEAANMVHVGLPGLIGLDMANSVMLLDPPFGEGWAEKVGNVMGGPLGSILGSVTGAATAQNAPEPEAGKRVYDALANSIPMFRELNTLAHLLDGDYDLRDPLGRLRYKASFTDMVKKVLGFKITAESNTDMAISAMMEMKEKRDAVLNYAASRYGQARVAGIPLGDDMQALVKSEVDNWNAQWPEFPITGDAILSRTKSRADAATQNLRERMLRSMPKVIRDAEQFRLPPGGG